MQIEYFKKFQKQFKKYQKSKLPAKLIKWLGV